jgi:hypothetical protein
MTARFFCSMKKETNEERAEMMGFRAWYFFGRISGRGRRSRWRVGESGKCE